MKTIVYACNMVVFIFCVLSFITIMSHNLVGAYNLQPIPQTMQDVMYYCLIGCIYSGFNSWYLK